MRALSKFEKGIIRVENPPISNIDVLSPNSRENETSETLLKVKIRFAFDAIRVVANGGRTVRLELKKSNNPQVPTAQKTTDTTLSPSFSTMSKIESTHVGKVENLTVSVFEFDILKSLPDDSISKLKFGHPIEYSYLRAVKTQIPLGVKESPPKSDRDYLLHKLEIGVDPATLSETFTLSQPGKVNKQTTKNVDSFYTRPVTSTTGYQRMKLYSPFVVYEEYITLSLNNFLSSQVFEFSYIDFTGTPIEFAEVRVPTYTIYNNLSLLQYSGRISVNTNYKLSSQIPIRTEYVRNITSTNSLSVSKYDSQATSSRSKTPKITRTHYTAPGVSSKSIKFTSRVFGLPGRRSKISKQSNSTKSFVIPFYIDLLGTSTSVKITKVPKGTLRLTVGIKNLTKNDTRFTEVATARALSNSASIGFVFPKVDCTYEVRLTTTDKKGRSKIGCNILTYDHINAYKNAVLNISKPLLVGDQSVKFTIAANFNAAGRQDIINLIDSIKAAGVSETVLSAAGYTSDSALYSETFSCLVEKIDFDTGLQSYFKELQLGPAGTSFTDRMTSLNGAAYVFSLGVRSPSSLIPQQPTYKFGTFGGRYLRSLPSNSSATENAKSGATFQVLDSGIKQTAVVETTAVFGKITNVTITNTPRNSNLLLWTYDGLVDELDHFQVFGSADGVECLLGCSFLSNSYEDSILYDRVGVVTYRIRPVHLTMEPGTSFSISVLKHKTLPSIIEQNFSNGHFWTNQTTAINSSLFANTIEQHAEKDSKTSMSKTINQENTRPNVSSQSEDSVETSAGLFSTVQHRKSSPRTTFPLYSIAESSTIFVPTNQFVADAIASQQLSGVQPLSTITLSSVDVENSLRESQITSVTSTVIVSSTQDIAFKRVLR